MRFALLGEGAKALAVAQAVIAHPDHRLVRQISMESVDRPRALGAVISGGAAVSIIPGIRVTRNWEELLTDAEVDAVIVGGTDEELQAVVRQLVQAGKAVLVAPELVQSAAFFYELALVESESPEAIFPMLSLRGHPLVRKLHELIAQGVLGNIRHVQFDRKIASHAAHGRAATMSPPELANALLIDSDLLRSLCGSYDQVTASRSGDAGLGYSLATVMLAGSGVPQAVWTAKAHSENDWLLTISGDAGTALLDGNPEEGRLRLTHDRHELPADAEETSADAGSWLLETFTASLASKSVATSPAEEPPPEDPVTPTLWGELARAVELVDAVERSVRRRRTIDVYFETPSERGIFKTQMTAARIR